MKEYVVMSQPKHYANVTMIEKDFIESQNIRTKLRAF